MSSSEFESIKFHTKTKKISKRKNIMEIYLPNSNLHNTKNIRGIIKLYIYDYLPKGSIFCNFFYEEKSFLANLKEENTSLKLQKTLMNDNLSDSYFKKNSSDNIQKKSNESNNIQKVNKNDSFRENKYNYSKESAQSKKKMNQKKKIKLLKIEEKNLGLKLFEKNREKIFEEKAEKLKINFIMEKIFNIEEIETDSALLLIPFNLNLGKLKNFNYTIISSLFVKSMGAIPKILHLKSKNCLNFFFISDEALNSNKKSLKKDIDIFDFLLKKNLKNESFFYTESNLLSFPSSVEDEKPLGVKLKLEKKYKTCFQTKKKIINIELYLNKTSFDISENLVFSLKYTNTIFSLFNVLRMEIYREIISDNNNLEKINLIYYDNFILKKSTTKKNDDDLQFIHEIFFQDLEVGNLRTIKSNSYKIEFKILMILKNSKNDLTKKILDKPLFFVEKKLVKKNLTQEQVVKNIEIVEKRCIKNKASFLLPYFEINH